MKLIEGRSGASWKGQSAYKYYGNAQIPLDIH